MALSGATGSVLEQAASPASTACRALLEGNGGGDAGDLVAPATSSSAVVAATCIEGRGGDDLIDGDSSLNVRISVRANVNGTGAETRQLRQHDRPAIAGGHLQRHLNPGQLTIVREIVDGGHQRLRHGGVLGRHRQLCTSSPTTRVSSWSAINADPLVVGPGGFDGDDIVVNIERLQFSDTAAILDGDGIENAQPEGQLRINDTTPRENQLLTALKRRHRRHAR